MVLNPMTGSHKSPVKSKANKTAPGKAVPKTSAFYMRRMRDALYAAGYVKHEAYVLPENKLVLKEMEKRLRQPLIAGTFKMESYMTAGNTWSTKRLFDALSAVDIDTLGDVHIVLIEGAEQAIRIEMNDFGGLPIFIVVAGEQIIVDTLLVGTEGVADEHGFNDAVLRSREMFPLSSIGIETMPNGESAYNMFGALSASSTVTNVVTEILTLAENVQRAVVAFDQFFRK
ncbi:hypothetical protein SAMN05216600_1337 [Pseudomonas cuatrocienegasensis]|uniref:DUF2170 family protein n=2 Tax=Pseudomonas TaxID=286 RepID=A0ABY1BRP2_9PSED|nr:hypothetical protein SAMN05216600_1337 [Pseudomonas cuatrocienegasensis]